jgi:hypothetical protein
MTAADPRRRTPWPGLAFVLLLALGAAFRQPAPAAGAGRCQRGSGNRSGGA